MKRIASAFETAAAQGRGVLVIYVCGGDPSLDVTEEIVIAAAEGGADIVEVGIPYSDPIADGPVIQAASQRALRAGTTVGGVLETVARIRKRSEVPVVIMTCYNPVLQFGEERFASQAAQAGVDAVLVSDLPPEESDGWVEHCKRHDLGTVFLVAPTTLPERIPQATRRTTAFVYAVSRPGTTGERDELPPDLAHLVDRIRQHTDKPVVIGFGISNPAQVRAVCRVADGVVVGSAVVRLIDEQTDPGAIAPAVRQFVEELAEGAKRR